MRLNLLRPCPFADKQKNTYFGTALPVYVKSKEKIAQCKYWSTCGDLGSKRYGETFKLYREISHYNIRSRVESLGRNRHHT
jgi:hypothetical protein